MDIIVVVAGPNFLLSDNEVWARPSWASPLLISPWIFINSLLSPPLTAAEVIIQPGEIFLIVGSSVSGSDITGGTFT